MNCTQCGGATRFVAQYQQNWCDNCRIYIGVAGAAGMVAPRKGPNLWLIIGLPVGAVLVLVGILVYSSVTAFQGYVKKSKRSETTENLHSMARGAEYYFQQEQSDGLAVLTGQLPESVGPTPPLGACCQSGGKCMPEAGDWSHPSWRALDFELTHPHYYSYEFRRNSTGDGFEALAYGDLDCDGDYSTFILSGEVDPAMGEGLFLSPTIYREQELE